MSKIALRNFWFQFHKWIGILLAILIIPICVTGAVLVWHEPLDRALNSQRYAFAPDKAVLPPAAYVDAARKALAPGERIVALRFSGGEPVTVAVARARKPGERARGRPLRTVISMDPGTARVLDKADGNAGILRVMHQIHGSLMVPGAGRQIVGWVGVAMLISSISGIWLWWPVTGSVRRGFRWKRGDRHFDTNLHHQFGFWIALPLFVLSLTGAWISFPAFFGAISGEAQQQRPGQPDRMAMMRAQPLETTATSFDRAVATATPLAGKPLTAVEWPTDMKAQWSLSFGGQTVTVDDASGKAEAAGARGPQKETTARLMRRIHDGTDMGLVWQVVIFLGGVLPTALAITGLTMWRRTRKWRGAAKRKGRGRLAAA
jgi:uncharacterized iron-regulated membrane protein